MNRQEVYTFFSLIGIVGSDCVDQGNWVMTVCPLAHRTHSGGVDLHPSFGVSVVDDGDSVYYCFGCSDSVKPLGLLLHALHGVTGVYPADAAAFLMTRAVSDVQVPVIFSVWDADPFDSDPGARLPSEDFLRCMPLLSGAAGPGAKACRDFLNRRGVDPDTAAEARVRYLPRSRAVVFPFTDTLGRERAFRARSIEDKRIWTVKPEHFRLETEVDKIFTSGFCCDYRSAQDSSHVVLVEGELDALRLRALGFSSVLSTGGSKVSAAQLAGLHHRVVYVGFDADEEGRRCRDRVARRLRCSSVVHLCDWSLVGCKDPGELRSADQARRVLRSAVIFS